MCDVMRLLEVKSRPHNMYSSTYSGTGSFRRNEASHAIFRRCLLASMHSALKRASLASSALVPTIRECQFFFGTLGVLGLGLGLGSLSELTGPQTLHILLLVVCILFPRSHPSHFLSHRMTHSISFPCLGPENILFKICIRLGRSQRGP